MRNKHIRELTQVLAIARTAKGITQLELGTRIGAPQSHVSRIEAGKVDLRASSLVELARNLDLELMLVPRSWVPAVRKLTQGTSDKSGFLYRLPE